MRTLTIAAINELEHAEIVPRFTGTVQQVFKQKTGPGEFGPWYLQNMVVTDDTGEISVTWTGAEPLERLQGKQVEFSSSETKHGLQGCKREVKTGDDGKVYEGVRLTPSCKITVQGGDGAQEAPAPPPAAPPARSNGVAGDGVAAARQHAMQIANLMQVAMEASRWCFMQYQDKHSVDLPDAHFQAMCATFYISLKDDGFLKKMPAHAVEHAKKAAAKPKPAPPPPPPVVEDDSDDMPF